MSQKCFRSVCVTCHKAQHVECRLGASVIGLINATAAAAAMTFLHVQCRQHMHHKDIHHIPGAPFIFAINPSFFFFFCSYEMPPSSHIRVKKKIDLIRPRRGMFFDALQLPIVTTQQPAKSEIHSGSEWSREVLRKWKRGVLLYHWRLQGPLQEPLSMKRERWASES